MPGQIGMWHDDLLILNPLMIGQCLLLILMTRSTGRSIMFIPVIRQGETLHTHHR